VPPLYVAENMKNPDVRGFFKKWKLLIAALIVVVAYLGAGMVFREYRMNPKNKYYGTYLPSSTPTVSHSEEETEKIMDAMFRNPNLMERIFSPAEWVFRIVGI